MTPGASRCEGRSVELEASGWRPGDLSLALPSWQGSAVEGSLGGHQVAEQPEQLTDQPPAAAGALLSWMGTCLRQVGAGCPEAGLPFFPLEGGFASPRLFTRLQWGVCASSVGQVRCCLPWSCGLGRAQAMQG